MDISVSFPVFLCKLKINSIANFMVPVFKRLQKGPYTKTNLCLKKLVP